MQFVGWVSLSSEQLFLLDLLLRVSLCLCKQSSPQVPLHDWKINVNEDNANCSTTLAVVNLVLSVFLQNLDSRNTIISDPAVQTILVLEALRDINEARTLSLAEEQDPLRAEALDNRLLLPRTLINGRQELRL